MFMLDDVQVYMLLCEFLTWVTNCLSLFISVYVNTRYTLFLVVINQLLLLPHFARVFSLYLREVILQY